MNSGKRDVLAGRIPNAVKTGLVSGFVLAWAISCPSYISFLTPGNSGVTFLIPFLAGLLLSLTATVSGKVRNYFRLLPWQYVSLSSSLLLFARLFTTGALYFSLSSFLLGICAFYLLSHLAVLFITSEEPVCLTGTALLVVMLLGFLADTCLYLYPGGGNLLSFVLSFFIPVFFSVTKSERGDGIHPFESVRTCLHPIRDKSVLKYLLLLLFCLLTVFLIYLLGSYYLNNSIMMGYGYWFYALNYSLYFAAVVFFSYIIGKYNPSCILGYCVSVFACATVLAVASFNRILSGYLCFFLYSVSTAGTDLFAFLIIVFLAKQTKQSVFFILGVVFYWRIVELSTILGVNMAALYDARRISLLVIVIILLAFPILASRNMILPLRNAGVDLKEKANILGEEATAGDNSMIRLSLTAAEKNVYHLICQGLSNADIAAALNISLNTVKFHVRNILQKAGVKNRVELVTLRHNK